MIIKISIHLLKRTEEKFIGDFQQFQEELWVKSLKSKHKLTLNKRTIKRLKKEYN